MPKQYVVNVVAMDGEIVETISVFDEGRLHDAIVRRDEYLMLRDGPVEVQLHVVENDTVRHFDCQLDGLEHVIVDCSSGGPDSGDMDHACSRCGQYWHVQLY